MSDKNKLSKNESTGSKTPAKKKVKGSNRFIRWFREMRSELKKVVWPTPKQIVNNTFVALTVMTVAAIVIWAIDYAGNQIFQAIRLLGS
jgi:preprotein translocase subunit SecE